MRIEQENSKLILREKLEASVQKYVQRPIMGETTNFAPDLLKPLYDYIYQYELTEKEQARLALFEFQTLLLETAFIKPADFKKLWKESYGVSKLDAIIGRVVSILRSDQKYWIDSKSENQAEISIAAYNSYIEEIKCAKSPYTLQTKDASEHIAHKIDIIAEQSIVYHASPPVGTVRCRIPVGRMYDLYQYLKMQCIPQDNNNNPLLDYMLQGLIILFVQKAQADDICKDYPTSEIGLRPTYDLRKKATSRTVSDKEQIVSIEELWRNDELIAFDFFTGQNVRL